MKTLLLNIKNLEPVRWIIIFSIILALLIMVSSNAGAQNKWNFEFRPAVDFPVKDLENIQLKTGAGFEGNFGYLFMPHFSAYAGWSWNKFTTTATTPLDFEETGYTMGLRFMHPFQKSSIQYFIGAGGNYKHIEIENTAGNLINDSGHGWGWQVEGGIALAAGPRWEILPGIRYHSLSRQIYLGESGSSVDLNYISAGIGVKWKF
jgi:hypothetical protein